MRSDGRENIKKLWSFIFIVVPSKKTKTERKSNLMGILILKKACYRAIVKVFVVITIIKTIIMEIVNHDNNNSIINNNKKY